MVKQSDTSNTVNPFELEVLKKRLISSDFQSLYQRVSNICHSSLAVHIWNLDTLEDILVWSNGKFPLCSLILSDLIGNKKCFFDRYNNAKQATNLKVPLFYKCHMGFSCGLVYLTDENRYSIILTVGPFYIEETMDVLYSRVVDNLGKLNLNITKKEQEQIKLLPQFSLDSVREILQWTRESFHSVWERLYENEVDSKLQLRNKKRQNKKVKENNVGSIRYIEVFDKIRIHMFLIAIQTKNKQLMGLILKGKGEELHIQQKKLQDVKFSLYTWVMNILSSLFLNNAGVELINKEKLLILKKKLFSEDKSLKIFVRDIIQIVFSAIDKEYCFKENKVKRFSQFFSMMERKLMSDNSLLSIAEEMQMSPSALSHWVKRNVGKNYEEFLDYIQVEKMAEFLRNTDKNLSEIGECVGIGYSSLVSEKFKRLTGLNPTEYKTLFKYRSDE